MGWRLCIRESPAGNLDVLKPMDGKLVSIGSLRDIADGQRIMAASFSGSKAFVTTAEFDEITMLTGVDPLHGIDLSNPTNPKELSDVVIPGVSTHLQWGKRTLFSWYWLCGRVSERLAVASLAL